MDTQRYRTAARALAAALAVLAASGASALDVVWDGRTPEANRKWADAGYFRVQMETMARMIYEALFEGDPARQRVPDNYTIALYAAPTRGGNPAFASGRRITWKTGANPGGTPDGGAGCICHEMTHVIDPSTDRTMCEGMADWTRNYKVWYPRCTNPAAVLDKRYAALRGGRRFGKYKAGANFLDFMDQNYGPGAITRIFKAYRERGKAAWPQEFGKQDFEGLMAEWRKMQTIFDPVFMWTYDGTAEGKVRHDRSWCDLSSLSARDTSDKSGAWLYGASGAKLKKDVGGNMTVAVHGWFPRTASPVAIASLGAAARESGKAVLLATSTKADQLTAYVLASAPGAAYAIVSATPVGVPGLAASPHSLILTARGGDLALVVVDGRPAARIDMKSKCHGCTFAPAFAVGGMHGGIGLDAISEPHGAGVRIDDVRVFSRTFRARETKQYATVFGPGYRPAVAAKAEWTGINGGTAVGDPGSWNCYNSVGEKIFAVPTRETAVRVMGRRLPSIPKGTKFECRSFTIEGWALLEDRSIDLRGVRIVDLSDCARVVTKGSHALVVSCLRAKRMKLEGSLAVATAMKVSERIDAWGGSVIRFPADADKAVVGEIVPKGEGVVSLKPGVSPAPGQTCRVARVEKLPEDFSRFRLHGAAPGQDSAEFKRATDGRSLSVTRRR